jgi:hypothetical protein
MSCGDTSPESVKNICLAVMAVILSLAQLLSQCYGEHTGVSWRPITSLPLLHAWICFHATTMHSPVPCKLQGSVFALAYEQLTFHSSVKTTSLNTVAWGRRIRRTIMAVKVLKEAFY